MGFFKLLILSSSTCVLVILVSFPVSAQSNQSTTSFLSQFQQIYQSLQRHVNAYKSEFTQAWGELGSQMDKAIRHLRKMLIPFYDWLSTGDR